MLNGIVFILIGLELPVIVKGLNGHSVQEAVISLVTIVVRVLWIFPGAYLPGILSKRIRKRETKPGWRSVLLVGWSGMRGVVSLAAALSIPLMLDKQPFPHRNLILFITFVVTLFTLVLQGLSLAPVIKFLKIESGEKNQRSCRLWHCVCIWLSLCWDTLIQIIQKKQEPTKHKGVCVTVMKE